MKTPRRTDGTQPLGPTDDRSVLLRVEGFDWRIASGPGAGRRQRVLGDRTTIGAADDNDLVLDDPTVSRYHAEVIARPEGFEVRDLGSRNGTAIDGTRIKEAFLRPGARLACGGTTLVLEPATDDVVIQPSADDHLHDLLGASVPMRLMFGVLRRIAPSQVSVLIHGETGTGKDLVARALHALSSRVSAPFVTLDCGAVDRELVSAELFGNEVGAYTGAAHARPGAFEQAHGGTLFIDEIGELALDLQPKLLRALERREVRRLGGTKDLRIDCRVIAATHRNLRELVAAGRFRQDLYYRLAQITVAVPPLRDRRDDVRLLADHFLAAIDPRRTFDESARAALAQAPLPGNVRELRNLVERAAALATGPAITAADLYLEPAEPAPAGGRLEDVERAAIEAALARHRYHRGKVALELGISDNTLRDKIRRYGIVIPRIRNS